MSIVKIRKLKRRDRKTLSNLVKKLALDDDFKNLLSMFQRPTDSAGSDSVSSDEYNLRMVELGMSVLRLLLDKLEDDVCAWFADLIGVSPEDFDDLAFGVELEIIEQLRSAKEVSDFFAGASRLYKSITKSRGTLTEEKEQSDSVTD